MTRRKIIVLFALGLSFSLFSWTNSKKTEQPPFLPGNEIREKEFPPAYPQSAAYNVRKWDVFTTGDYICWKWNQSILPLTIVTTSDSIITDQFISKSTTINDLNPQYASGFQVGLGFTIPTMDQWQVFTEYTWYKNKQEDTTTTGANQNFTQTTANSQFNSFNQIGTVKRVAKMSYESLDVQLQRPFYLGKRLITNLFLGITNEWITQNITADYNVQLIRLGLTTDIFGVGQTYGKQTSWGIGPKLGANTSWLLGYGIKLLGNFSAANLLSHYQWRNHTNALITDDGVEDPITTKFARSKPTYNFVPVTFTSMGLGWGSYLGNNGLHFDISALYDINVYWDYSNSFAGVTSKMLLHGLNIRAAFDF